MPELAIHLHGPRPSFDPSAGPLSARVEVEGGTDAYLIDVERGRCRLAAIPGPGRGKWTSAAGLLMLARAGWAGCRAFEDRLPRPGTPADFPRTRTPEDAVKASNRAAASRALLAAAKRAQSLALDLRSALMAFEGEPWAQTLVLQSRRLASDCEERAVDLGRAPREEDRPLIAAIEARANITKRDTVAEPVPIRESVIPAPVSDPPGMNPVSWRVWDDVRSVELEPVTSASLEGARKKARRAHPGLRKVRVEPIAASP